MRPIDLPVLIISAALFVLVYGFVNMARSAIKAHCALNKARWSCQKMSAKLRDVTCSWHTDSNTLTKLFAHTMSLPARVEQVGGKLYAVKIGDLTIRLYGRQDPETNKRLAEELTVKLNQQP